MLDVPLLLVVIVVVALIFDFTNGVHDCANAIATVVTTKVLAPRTAVIMAASLNLVGALLGSEVAHTLGKGIVNTEIVMGSQILVLAALIGAIAWNLLTWYFGFPSSSSHALIGGLIGAAVTHAGFASLNSSSIISKIILPLILSPLAGFAIAYGMTLMLQFLLRKADRRTVNQRIQKVRILSAAFMATSHGLNDAQKTMGVITLALFLFQQIGSIEVPFWVKLSCAMAMGLGTAMGGWKIIKTMGNRITKLEMVNGLAAETSASLIITGASLIGAPISTTHTITACIFGTGSSKRLSAVRWELAANLALAWVVTIPASAIVASLFYFLLQLCGVGK